MKKFDPVLYCLITKIMKQMKGWDAKTMAEDLADHPEVHAFERKWLTLQLSRYALHVKAQQRARR